PVPRDPVAGLDQAIDAVRVRLGYRQPDLAVGLRGEPVPRELLPGRAAVTRRVETGARPAALPTPGVDLELPHPGEQDARVVRVHGDVGSAGVRVHEPHPCPRTAAVRRP